MIEVFGLSKYRSVDCSDRTKLMDCFVVVDSNSVHMSILFAQSNRGFFFCLTALENFDGRYIYFTVLSIWSVFMIWNLSLF